MPLKKYKPTTPSRRWTTVTTFDHITATKPYKPLLLPIKRTGGRNAQGRVTVRHIGGGHKKLYRIIDFKRDKRDVVAKVLTIEYDPNRSANIALLQYPDGEKRYIICPQDLNVGNEIISAEKTEIKVGNCMPLKNMPLGTVIHNIELSKGKGGQVVRSAGSSAQLLAKEGEHAHVKMPSGEIRLIKVDCCATIGQVGNIDHMWVSLGKAGRSRWLGIRPTVRGVAMNPVDHPMGGGEGKSSGGRPSSSPWGKYTKGLKTRNRRKYSNNFIIKRRPSKKKSK